VLDFDHASGRTGTRPANEIAGFVKDEELEVEWILESHVHADHLSAAPYLQDRLGEKIGTGVNITLVQDTFGKVLNEGTAFQRDGSQFDALFREGDSFHFGQMRGDVLFTPGHTPACMSYLIGDAAFVGGTFFMPDLGTARCDCPGGPSEALYSSIQKILALPSETWIFVGHDYKVPGWDEFVWETTVGEQKALNIHVGQERNIEEFVKMRDARDATLAMPRLILPARQVNMRAGRMPKPDAEGDVFLKIPVNKL